MKRWFKFMLLIIGAVLIGAVVVSAAIKAVGGSSTRALAADVNPGAATTTVANTVTPTPKAKNKKKEKEKEKAVDVDTLETSTGIQDSEVLAYYSQLSKKEQKEDKKQVDAMVDNLRQGTSGSSVDITANQRANTVGWTLVKDNPELRMFSFKCFAAYDEPKANQTGWSDAVIGPVAVDESNKQASIKYETIRECMQNPIYLDSASQMFSMLATQTTGMSFGRGVIDDAEAFVDANTKSISEYESGKATAAGTRTWEKYLEMGTTVDGQDAIMVTEDQLKEAGWILQLIEGSVFLGETNESSRVHWPLNSIEVKDNLLRRTFPSTDRETETWLRMGYVRKGVHGEEIVEAEYWINKRDGRFGLPGNARIVDVGDIVPIPNRSLPTPTPAQGNRPTPTPGQGNQPTPTPVVVVTATPIPTPPGQGNPSVTPTPVVVTVTPVPDTPTPVPNTPVPDTPTPVPPTPTPGKRPEEIIEDDHPNRQDSDGVIMPGDQEDEEEDLVPVVDHENGYTDSDGDYVQPADDWNPGRQDDSWTYTYVEEYDDTGYNGPAQDTTPTIPSGNSGGTGDGGGTSYVEPAYEDADHSWEPAPGIYTAPEDCNDDGSVQDELSQVIDDTAGYSDPLAYNVTPQQAEQEYNDQEEEVVPDGINGSGGVDNSWMGGI